MNEHSMELNRRLLLAGAAGLGVAAAMPGGRAQAATGGLFSPGFDLDEALDLTVMCEFIHGDTPEPPAGWSKVFDSPVINPFDNKWQLWKKGGAGPYAVIIRGTVAKTGSIIEDALFPMAKADGQITVANQPFPYKFANHPKAGVHTGFMLGALLLLSDPTDGILAQLHALPEGSSIYVAGHSQGAAVATLVRSYLNYTTVALPKFYYKTYVFAQPKPGNDYYAADFANLFSNNGYGYRINNSLDWVPQVCFTVQTPYDVNTPNPLSKYIDLSSLRGFGFLQDVDLRLAMRNYQSQVNQLGQIATRKQAPKLQLGASALLRTRIPGAANTNQVSFPILPSLNYVAAASEIALIGHPCDPKTNTCDEWYQHSLKVYRDLMREQLTS